MYGVYMPTSQEYLNLFSNYVSQVGFESKKNLVDLGCGSGILPIILKENGKFKGKIHCLDSTENAVECAKMNMELYGILEQNIQNADIVDLWHPISGTPDAERSKLNFYQSIVSEMSMPMNFDLITCNPPWLPASYLKGSLNAHYDMDNAIYDPKE